MAAADLDQNLGRLRDPRSGSRGHKEAGLLEGERALHLLVLLPHLASLAAPEHELWDGREVEVERAGGGAPVSGAPHLGRLSSCRRGSGRQDVGGRGAAAADATVVVLPLVPAERLAGWELLVADGAPVDSARRRRTVGGRGGG